MNFKFEDLGIVTNNYGAAAPDGMSYAEGKHTGIDVKLKNKFVRAFTGGEVVSVSDKGAYGKHVWIKDSNGNYQLYAHLDKIHDWVKPKAKVMQSMPLGTEGSTGKSTGKHLHYEVRKNINDGSSSINPVTYLGSALNGVTVKDGILIPSKTDLDALSNGSSMSDIAGGDIGNNAISKISAAIAAGDFKTIALRVILIVFGLLFLYLAIKNIFLGGK